MSCSGKGHARISTIMRRAFKRMNEILPPKWIEDLKTLGNSLRCEKSRKISYPTGVKIDWKDKGPMIKVKDLSLCKKFGFDTTKLEGLRDDWVDKGKEVFNMVA